MNKKLVFSFYLSRDTFDREINQLHFSCLSEYAHIFDEIIFVIIANDTEDTELIKKLQRKVIDLPYTGTITFKIVKNNDFRESYVFKTEVIDRLGEDDLVFFAHNKGISNVEWANKRQIYLWVVGMYYYSLNFMEEVDSKLVRGKYLSYGSFLTENKDIDNRGTKYGWSYIGTFFWMNSKKVKDYIELNNVYTPQLSDRFFDEDFLGNIYPKDLKMAGSHNDIYIRNAGDYYSFAENYIRTLYGDANDFYEFYNRMTI